jgi:hypothetical protein
MGIRASLKFKQSKLLTSLMRHGSWLLLLLIGLAIIWHGFSQIRAAPSSDIVYSTDGGTTWTTTPTAKSGQELLARLYYDNDTDDTIADAQMNSTLPSGFTLTPDSTRTCLNPATTDPVNPASELVCNDDSGQGGTISEAAVWSGDTLAIAPNAGIYGEATNATTGLMAAGKKRYVNLHQCLRQTSPAYDYITMVIDDPIATGWSAGTNASNTTDSAFDCNDLSGSGWTTHGTISGVQHLDLLGKRYVNLHQCSHYYADATYGNRWINRMVSAPAATNWGTGTNTSNTADSTPSCVEPGSGWTSYAPFVNAQPLDMRSNRYLNIHECVRYQPSPSVYVSLFTDDPPSAAWRTGTKASNAPDATLDCPAISGWTAHSTLSDFQVLDTLDTARGQGFVEYKMTAPSVSQTETFNQTAALTGTGTGDPTSNGSITVEPDLQIIYSADGGASWTTDPNVPAGTNLLVRLFSHNKRDLTANASQFGTTLPAGFSLVPGTTRVCLNPGTTDAANPLAETLCNDSAGQGGVINEGAVWIGQDLTISPTAGLFGQATNLNSGYLAAGKKKYANLHQCVRSTSPAYDWITVAVDNPPASAWYASSNTSNTADAALDCGSETGGWPLNSTISGLQNLDLFGKRYANLHQCNYSYADATNGTRRITNIVDDQTGSWVTGTNTSNIIDSAVSCNGGASWTQTTISGVQPLDILENRYINFHECLHTAASPSQYLPTFLDDVQSTAWRTGTNAGNSADTTLNCPAPAGWTLHSTLSAFQVFDTLDTTRGQVFVEFEMTAPSPQMQTEYTQTAALTGTSTGDESVNDAITVLVDPGVIVTQTDGSTNVTEGGASDTINVQLTAPPSQDVTVNFTDSNGQLVSIPPVVFTSSNWNIPQPVTITAIDDDIIEGPHTDNLNYTTSSGDTAFNSLAANDVVTVNIADNDAPGANVIVTDDVTSEDGDTGQFCLTLFTQPSADVTIALSSADTNEVSVPPSVTILASNWNQQSANCVTVTGVDDGPVGDPVKAVTITTGNVTSADSNYNLLDGSTIDDVTIYNQNNDPPGFKVIIVDGTTTEDGGTATVQIQLLSQPDGGADVTIPLSIDDPSEGTLSGITSITITNANWNNPTANQVIITGVDDDLTDGNITYHLITGDPTSADPAYDILTADDIVNPLLTNIDTDIAGVTITPTGGSTNVTEGGATDTVDVVLNTKPAPGNQVVVTVQPQPQLNVGAGPGTAIQLTFDTNNWNTPQTITVSANDDNQLEGNHTALIQYLINTGLTTEQRYKNVTGLPATTVNITDNDTATVSIVKLDDAAENPANNGHFRVTLSKQNSTGNPITINYAVSGTATAGSDYIPLSGSVDISSGASSADITVDVTGMDDDLLEGTQTVVITLTSSGNPQVTVGSPSQATVGIADDEVQTATASLQVAGNGSEAGPVDIIYQVVLSNQNETGTPISFSIDPAGGSAVAGTDYTSFSGQVIRVPNGATSGTYNVGVIDNNLVQGSRTARAIIGNPSLVGLNIITSSATATIADNDSAEVTVAATDATATENSSDGEFTISLNATNNGPSPVIVTYSVSGSATAGTDYAPLSGQIEIPVGASSATISVATAGYHDAQDYTNKSVIITLTNTDNSSFAIGVPAAAVIVISNIDTEPEPAPEPQPEPEQEPQPSDEPAPSASPSITQNQPNDPESTPTPTPEPQEEPWTDTDHDDVPDEIEDLALNNGDGNGDGIPDKDQSNVASIVSSVTSQPVTLAVSGDCQHIHGFNAANPTVEDPGYTYPRGLFDFEISCDQPGQTAEVIMYINTTDHSDWVWRKFNRFGQTYASLGHRAQLATSQVGENMVTAVTYQITDGDDLDEDGQVNSIILDPSGPSLQEEGTGYRLFWLWWLSVPLILTILWLFFRQRHRNQKV